MDKKKKSSAKKDLPLELFQLDQGVLTFLEMVSHYEFDTVLDISATSGDQAKLLRYIGKKVFSIGEDKKLDYQGDFLDITFDRTFDAVWCCHSLMHQRNVGAYLDKIFSLVTEGGVVAITVPVHPVARMVSGDISIWTPGLLCYNIIAAGYDCSHARMLNSFELCCVVSKHAIKDKDLSIGLHTVNDSDQGHRIDDVDAYFPFPVFEGCNGGIPEVNWIHDYHLPSPKKKSNIRICSKPIGEFTLQYPEFTMSTKVQKQ